jgi:hypothetical protein
MKQFIERARKRSLIENLLIFGTVVTGVWYFPLMLMFAVDELING